MYLIIAGCNAIGAALAGRMALDGHDIAIIDRNQDSFARLGAGNNYLTVAGIPIDEEVLKSAGIEKAAALFAVTDDDNTNIMIAEIAAKLYQVRQVIIRTDDPEKQEIMRSLGLLAVCPVTLCADQLYQSARWGQL